MSFESTQPFKPQIPGDPRNRSYTVKVLNDGTTIIEQREIIDNRTATQVMGRIPKNGTFEPEKIGTQTLPNEEQISYFTTNSTNIVKNYSVPTVFEGIGGSDGGGFARVNQILGTNISPPPPPPDPQSSLTTEQQNRLPDAITSKGKKIEDVELVYPQGIRSNGQDVIKFSMFDYEPPRGLQRNEGENFTGIIRRGTVEGTPRGRVFLPIQPTIIDSNSVDWQQDLINPIELAGLELSSSFIQGGVEGASQSIDNILKIIGSENENIKNAIIAGAAGAAIGKNVLARLSGGILNPNVELLFNAPSLRTFNYRFQLSPRSSGETNSVKEIIKWFKRGMAVQRTEQELFLKTPNIFKIQYLHKDETHPYINQIKTCALTNCSVDYTPTGSYATFTDGSMVSYILNLTFQELEPIYYDDYDGIGGVGF